MQKSRKSLVNTNCNRPTDATLADDKITDSADPQCSASIERSIWRKCSEID